MYTVWMLAKRGANTCPLAELRRTTSKGEGCERERAEDEEHSCREHPHNNEPSCFHTRAHFFVAATAVLLVSSCYDLFIHLVPV